MANASALRKGMQVTVTSGVYGGRKAIVIDPTVIPDGDPSGLQRRILIEIEDIGETHILPRLIDIGDRKPAASSNQSMAALRTDQYEEFAGRSATRVLLEEAEDITDPMDNALDKFRPSRDVLKRFVSRTVAGGMTDLEYLLAIRDDRNSDGYSPNVAFVGETQSGKTMLVQALAVLAADRDGLPKPYPVFTLNGSSGISSYELFGQTQAVKLDGGEALVWMEGLVPMALKCGGFLYLDEFNAVPPSQATAIHPITDDRRAFTNYQRAVPDGHNGFRPEIVKAHKNLWVLTTINPGYKGLQTFSEALTNRFVWLEWDYDEAVEKILIPSVTVRMIGDALRTLRAHRSITVPVGTSALQKLNNSCARYGVDNAVWSFTAMFPPNERPKVTATLEARGFLDLLKQEFPDEDRIFKGAAATPVVEESEEVKSQLDWQPAF